MFVPPTLLPLPPFPPYYRLLCWQYRQILKCFMITSVLARSRSRSRFSRKFHSYYCSSVHHPGNALHDSTEQTSYEKLSLTVFFCLAGLYHASNFLNFILGSDATIPAVHTSSGQRKRCDENTKYIWNAQIKWLYQSGLSSFSCSTE